MPNKCSFPCRRIYGIAVKILGWWTPESALPYPGPVLLTAVGRLWNKAHSSPLSYDAVWICWHLLFCWELPHNPQQNKEECWDNKILTWCNLCSYSSGYALLSTFHVELLVTGEENIPNSLQMFQRIFIKLQTWKTLWELISKNVKFGISLSNDGKMRIHKEISWQNIPCSFFTSHQLLLCLQIMVRKTIYF